MYLKLTENIVDEAIAGNQHAHYILRQLNICVMLGTHFVFAHVKALDKIAANFAEDYPYLRKIREKYYVLGSQAAMIDWHVEFDLNHADSYVDKAARTIYISKIDAQHKSFYEETHLVAENLLDIDFYEAVLQVYKNMTAKRVHHRYYPILGGGATTARVMESEIKHRKSFVICIVDSDKHYLGDSVGATAQTVKSYLDKKACPFAQYYVMQEVTEVENLIPMKVYAQYAADKKDPDLLSRLSVLQKIGAHSWELLNYFDFKEGITHHMLQDASGRAHYVRCINIVDPAMGTSIKSNDDAITALQGKLRSMGLVDATLIEKTSTEAARNMKYIHGLGTKILDNILRDKSYLLYDIKKEDLSLAQLNEFMAIGSFLLDWTCSGQKCLS